MISSLSQVVKDKFWAPFYLVISSGLESVKDNNKDTKSLIAWKWRQTITDT